MLGIERAVPALGDVPGLRIALGRQVVAHVQIVVFEQRDQGCAIVGAVADEERGMIEPSGPLVVPFDGVAGNDLAQRPPEQHDRREGGGDERRPRPQGATGSHGSEPASSFGGQCNLRPGRHASRLMESGAVARAPSPHAVVCPAAGRHRGVLRRIHLGLAVHPVVDRGPPTTICSRRASGRATSTFRCRRRPRCSRRRIRSIRRGGPSGSGTRASTTATTTSIGARSPLLPSRSSRPSSGSARRSATSTRCSRSIRSIWWRAPC